MADWLAGWRGEVEMNVSYLGRCASWVVKAQRMLLYAATYTCIHAKDEGLHMKILRNTGSLESRMSSLLYVIDFLGVFTED